MVFIRESTPQKEGALNVSKLIKIPVLLDTKELELLFEDVGDCYFFLVQGINKKGESNLSKENFCKIYSEYINAIKEGVLPDLKQYQSAFSLLMSCSLDILYSIPIGADKEMIRSQKPVIQIQNNGIHYSSEDKQFRSMVLSKDSITWGLHFSYPQLYQDPVSKEVLTVNASSFHNTAIFKKLQLWMRRNTVPAYFFVEDSLIKSSIRIGRNCFEWINNHPQLREKKITLKQFSKDES